MNQDFTVQKKAILDWKKNRAEGFTWKKNSCTSREREKICASWKFPTPPPPHHFSNGPSLRMITSVKSRPFILESLWQLSISWNRENNNLLLFLETQQIAKLRNDSGIMNVLWRKLIGKVTAKDLGLFRNRLVHEFYGLKVLSITLEQVVEKRNNLNEQNFDQWCRWCG